MIDEKKLIEEIEKIDLHGRMREYAGLRVAVDIIKNQPKVGDWIPCSERLPENDNYILLSFENFSLPLVGRYEKDENGGAFYVGDCDEDDTCLANDLFVNAWMQLPEPYKEE